MTDTSTTQSRGSVEFEMVKPLLDFIAADSFFNKHFGGNSSMVTIAADGKIISFRCDKANPILDLSNPLTGRKTALQLPIVVCTVDADKGSVIAHITKDASSPLGFGIHSDHFVNLMEEAETQAPF